MNFPQFKDKKVLIMGLGLSGGGLGAAEWFVKQGAIVTITDKKTKQQLLPSIEKLSNLNIQYVLGEHRKSDFTSSDLIVRNPDVPIDSPYLNLARKKNIPIIMEESLFFELTPYKDHVIGVTGTRGKSTTTTLIYEIIKNSGRKALLGGNLPGRKTLSLLDEITKNTWVVLELSSWQLQGFKEIHKSPHIAVLTNIYLDHLNRYVSMNDYINDKKVIFQYQKENDYLIANAENDLLKKVVKNVKSKILWFRKNDVPKKWQIKIPGEHNRENIAAVICVCRLLGISTGIVQKTIEDFAGIEMRLQPIRLFKGVTYVNDTTSTTPVAGVMALRAFEGKPIILIAGGNSKNLDLGEFAKEMNKSVKALILLEGTATDELEQKAKKFSPTVNIIGRFNNFKKAVELAQRTACLGEIVLLSPGCTSFGMFANEFIRGEKFNTFVKELR